MLAAKSSSIALGGIGALLLIGCHSADKKPAEERTDEAQSSLFSNGDFETGAAGSSPPSWTVVSYINNGITVQTPQTYAGLNLTAGGALITTEINGVNQPDPDLGNTASLRWPRYGAQAARVNFHSNNAGGHGKNVNSLAQTMTIGAGDVDPSDGQIHVRFAIAPVLQNPGHPLDQQPYYFVTLSNVTQSTTLYSDFNLSGQPGVPWKTINGGTNQEIDYVDWALVDISPSNGSIAMGDSVKLEIIGAGCSLGGHFGEVYVDGVGVTIPGLYVSGKGPAQANAGANIAYALTYKNGAAMAETGVTIDFTTPPNTTFQSIVPPVGASCVTPAVGAAGVITCTFAGPVAAGATGGFSISVAIDPAATGSIVAGTYDIFSTQETPLLGNKITTLIGCAQDSDCAAGNWCHESAPNACLPTLPNGTSMPTDAPHANPTLNGTCTAQAAALVCTSAVCDPADSACGYLNGDGLCSGANASVVCRSGACDPDTKCGYANGDGPCSGANGNVVCRSSVCDPDLKCGYANGDGPCSAGNAAVRCRSSVCDPDLKCGYANGDGPCTQQNAGAICRSSACSQNNLCMPVGGCNVDADCAGGNWCNESAHTCTPKLVNGTPVPNDPPHANPTLNGVCSPTAASLVCLSGVCDGADNDCGYADGDGPCLPANGAVVCRSGACSVNGTCLPAGGCNVDADCMGGNWCNEGMHACLPKIANGGAMPNDPPHSNPTLDATCTTDAATLVCVSAVCDKADNECGYANGDGPCSPADAATVCRSGACSADATCMPAGGCNVDADCMGGNWCNEGMHACLPKIANGGPMPNDPPHTSPTLDATCTTDAATLVCASGVCDTADAKCGYADGDGPCSAADGAVVCRSGACSANGTCLPVGGCNVDADCAANKWCDESKHACSPKLPNGDPVPTDAPHMSPTLDGKCSVDAGALVCESGVCDTADDECGYANGHGPCTQDNGKIVCRSGTCGADGNCASGLGCTADADCKSGEWCNETEHACTMKLPNGDPIPTDAPHMSPTLDGKCSPDAAKLVCLSGVCDTHDDKCGYANGAGPCSADNGGEVCRSKICATSGANQGLCEACGADADCPVGQICGAASTCEPKADDTGTLEGGGCALSSREDGGDGLQMVSALGLLFLLVRRATKREQGDSR
jgi:hypothetical protein